MRKTKIQTKPKATSKAGKPKKRGKRKFIVDVDWVVSRPYIVEAESAEEAQRTVQERVDRGDVCVWTDGFETVDDCTVKTAGYERKDGSLSFYK